MTEKNLSEQGKTTAKRPWWLITGGALLLVFVALYLFRQPLAESAGRTLCNQQKLDCTLRVTRLDPGGITLQGVDVKATGAYASAFTAGRLAVNFDWSNPFAPRPSVVSGDGLTLRLNFSGVRPMLGDLDGLASSLPSGGGAGAMPRIDIQNFRVIADTLLGPVEARGFVTATGPGDFNVQLTAQPTRLSIASARIELAAAELNAQAKDGSLSAQAVVDLGLLEAPGARISDFALRFDIRQASDELLGTGGITLGQAEMRDQSLEGVSAEANLKASALDLEALTPGAILAALQSVSIEARSGAVAVAGVGWASAKLDVALARNGPGSASFTAADVTGKLGEVRGIEVVADLSLADAGLTASGNARATKIALSEAARADVGDAIRETVGIILPAFAPELARVVDKASRSFDFAAPLRASVLESGVAFGLMSGASLRAANGLVATLDGGDDRSVATLSGGDWSGAGTLRVSGGGGPDIRVTVGKTALIGDVITASGDVAIAPWRVADDTFGGTLSAFMLRADGDSGEMSGDIVLNLSGAMAGGVWKQARALGVVSATWSAGDLFVDAPGGLGLSWNEGRFGETVFGAGALRYRPQDRLAEGKGGALAGAGMLEAAEFPVSGASFSARAVLGATRVNWTLSKALRANFDMDPLQVWLNQSDVAIPIRIADIKGVADIADGWRIAGDFSGGTALVEGVSVERLAAGFALSGAGGALDGALTDVTLNVADTLPEATRRFEAVSVAGAARLSGGKADFDGVITLDALGVQLASVSGLHDLETGAGKLTFAPTPLIFQPRSFEPSDISPLLRGPANVTGRVDVSGAAAWSSQGLTARANAQFRRVGFALAGAGVFENVSGQVEISDLLALETPPGQEITIGRVTLGMPIDNGVVRFRLAGPARVHIESAEWPFAGGSIRVRDTDFVFGAPTNRVVAEAREWDLRMLVEQFKVPDVKVQGKVNGTFPVVFSTGSARVDKAVLEASQEGGVIQYSGSTGQAAGSADQNAAMLFEALKDFQYEVLRMSLEGDLAGNMALGLTLRGRNPAVMDGQNFDVNIVIDSPLLALLNSVSGANSQVDSIVSAITGGTN